MTQGTSKAKVHSQSTLVNKVKDWLIPDAIKEVKRNQVKTASSEGAKEVK